MFYTVRLDSTNSYTTCLYVCIVRNVASQNNKGRRERSWSRPIWTDLKFRNLEQLTGFFQYPKQCKMRICTSMLNYIHAYSPCIACIVSFATHLYDQPTSSPSHFNIYLVIIPSLWWWRHHIWLQHWCQPTIIHGVKALVCHLKTHAYRNGTNQRLEIQENCRHEYSSPKH
jgi:hypothetical protein